MNIKETFLKLTEYLIPYKMEMFLEKYLPKGIQKDSIGNYYITIGESKSMFTCHLDSYTKKLVKVVHILYDNGTKVRTDGKSPLGGDDKTGMCVMLNMIEKKVPGTYYFFIGEEPPLSGGVFGSKNALKTNPEFFTRFDRVIAFDRRGYGSIISRQNGKVCCSKEFVNALSVQFAKNNMEYRNDPTGYYTDSAVFMWTCSEITNLSCGGFNEHHNDEWVDLIYLEQIADVATKIDWESLPKVRDPKRGAPRPKKKVENKLQSIYSYKGFIKMIGYDLYKRLKDYMDYFYFQPDTMNFKEGENVKFVNVEDNSKSFKIKVHGGQIWFNDKKIGNIDAFERRMGIEFDCKFSPYAKNFIEDLKNHCIKFNTNEISYRDVQIILNKYGKFTVNELIYNYDSKDAIFDEDDFIIDENNKCIIYD
jgi:hypothetical protein